MYFEFLCMTHHISEFHTWTLSALSLWEGQKLPRDSHWWQWTAKSILKWPTSGFSTRKRKVCQTASDIKSSSKRLQRSGINEIANLDCGVKGTFQSYAGKVSINKVHILFYLFTLYTGKRIRSRCTLPIFSPLPKSFSNSPRFLFDSILKGQSKRVQFSIYMEQVPIYMEKQKPHYQILQ